MKKSLTFFFILLSLSLFSEEESSFVSAKDPEIRLMANLIEVSTQNLHAQKELLDRLIRFKEAQKLFLNDTHNKELAGTMMETAFQALKLIENHSLNHLFNPDFLNEITFFHNLITQ